MKTVVFALLAIICCLQYATSVILQPKSNGLREVLSLDGLWNFVTNNITVLPGTENKPNDNNDLNLMPVPASYNDLGTHRGLRDYAGSVTYSRTFFVPSSWKTKRVWIRFGSACYAANVTVNGVLVTKHSIGHLPFGSEITSEIKFDEKNFIEVVVDNILSNSTIPQGNVTTLGNGMLARTYTYDFFEYSGIDRSVLLYTTSNSYIEDIEIRTTVDGENNGTIIYVLSIQENEASSAIRISILDQEENIVATQKLEDVSGGNITLTNVTLWWPYTMSDNPGYLYTARVEILDNHTVVDRYDQTFGFRQLTWDKKSFKINGKAIYFRGFGRHEDSDLRGKGTDLPLFIRDHNLIRWIGANSYRTSHYPYSEELMDLADKLGLMIVDEVPAVDLQIFQHELLENHKKAFTQLYKRDKNRPSVVAWSCANEPQSQVNESGPYFRKIVAHMKTLDTTRPVTAAIAQSYDEDHLAKYLDIIGFNKYQAWYQNTGDIDGITDRIIEEAENWHGKFNKPIFMTEYGADSLEGLSILPEFIWTEEYQQAVMSKYFEAFDTLRSNHTWFIGEHIWNFADFKTAQSYTRVGGNKKGIFTRNRQPKASAFLLRKRYWALARVLDRVHLPSDLENYVENKYSKNNMKDEL